MKLIILDRDGVINKESTDYIKSPDEWIPIPGSLEAITRLTQAGYTIAVATNQSGVARQYFSAQMLEKIHQKMLKSIEDLGGKVFKVYHCPHLPTDNCNCRKPKTGMFEQLAIDLGIDLKSADPIFVGDSVCDVELGLVSGCRFFLVNGIGSDGDDTLSKLSADQKQKITVVRSLADVADRILR